MRKAKLTWLGNNGFRGETPGAHQIIMDRPDDEGKSDGPTPKEVTLLSMGGCTAMDVVAILRKMRQPLREFEIDLEAAETEDHPKVFNKVRLVYRFQGEGLDPERAHRAVQLSMEKYCGVSAMIAHTAQIEWAVEVNGRRWSPS